MGQRNTFLLKLCALLLVKLTKMGVTGKSDKTSPTSERRALLFTLGSLETHLGNLAAPFSGGVWASGSFTFSNFVDSLRTNQPKSNQIKSLLLSHHLNTSALVSEILTNVLQTVQKKKNYIWTVHIYRLYRRQCAKYTYIYSVHTVYYKDILSYQYTLYTVCTYLHYVHIYT